jgi:glycosyltransferase involved in cell wall biosynthesis
MEFPKVSVIIPNYNHSQFLEQRIDSVLYQTYQNIEIIILDDASLDNSRNIIEKYRGNNNISLIEFNSINSGSTFRQWEKGIKLAKGEFVWIAESDDYSDNLFLQKIVEKMQLDSEIGLACSASTLVDDVGKFIYNDIRNISYDNQGWYVSSGFEECKNHLLFNNTVVNASSAVFVRKLYFSVDSSFQLYKLAGDWQFWFDVSLNSTKIAYYSEPLNYFRQSSNSVSRGSSNSFKYFVLERLRVAIYIISKMNSFISLKSKFKILQDFYLFLIPRYVNQKFEKLSYKDIKKIIQLSFNISYFSPIVFFLVFFKKTYLLLIKKIFLLKEKVYSRN